MKIVKEFILREIAGECVLVPTGATSQEFNGMITISDTAKFIWENIEKVDSLEEMIRMVLDTYEIDEETARRIRSLLSVRLWRMALLSVRGRWNMVEQNESITRLYRIGHTEIEITAPLSMKSPRNLENSGPGRQRGRMMRSSIIR